jgi:seryl-tRNA synthetase
MEVYNRSGRVFDVDPRLAPEGKIKPGVVTKVEDTLAEKLLKRYPNELVAFKGERDVAAAEKKVATLDKKIRELTAQNEKLLAENKQLKKQIEKKG